MTLHNTPKAFSRVCLPHPTPWHIKLRILDALDEGMEPREAVAAGIARANEEHEAAREGAAA